MLNRNGTITAVVAGGNDYPVTDPVQGYHGGSSYYDGSGPAWETGGGGGASEDGHTDGNGYAGDGAVNAYADGTNTTYAGGGSGFRDHAVGASFAGGDGGGGRGGYDAADGGTNYAYNLSGVAGTANTGGGGGGGDGNFSGSQGGAAGGSGFVIIRYVDSAVNASGGTEATYSA